MAAHILYYNFDFDVKFTPTNRCRCSAKIVETSFPQTQEILENLGAEWVAFQQCIIDAEVMLRKNKEKFKAGLLSQAEEFRKRVGGLCSDFLQTGPFTSQFNPESALEIITQFKYVLFKNVSSVLF